MKTFLLHRAGFVFVFFLLIPSYGLLPQQSNPPAAPDTATRTEIALGEALLPKLADRAAGLYLLATDYAALGDSATALALLKECVESDEGFDPSADRAFAPLQANPQFQALVKRAAQHFPAVHQARLAFTVAEKDLVPEGLAAEAPGRVFYLSSLNRRKIVQIQKGVASDFVRTDEYALLPVLGLKIDPQDGGLWANTGTDGTGEAELLHFDAEGQLLSRSGPPSGGRHLFNDLVLRGDREIFLTDSLANQVYRFDRKMHTFTALEFSRALYYPNGIALSTDGNHLFAADAFGVLQYDLRNASSTEVQPGRGATLAGVDGMYWDRGWLVVVQNGIGVPRLARFQLTADGTRVIKAETLEYRSPFVELPTTGAILGNSFYFIGNSQIDNMKDDRVLDPAKLRPVRVAVLRLK